MTLIKPQKTNTAGIALLMTIMVLSVVVAVTLAIVELSLKQLQLSVDTRDSEIAFHAANAGLECARYARRAASTTIERGANSSPFNCLGDSTNATKRATSSNGIEISAGLGAAHRSSKMITWGGNRCSVIDLLVIVSSTSSSVTVQSSDATFPSLKTEFPGFPTNTKVCPAGAKCTIAAVAGYNSPCATINNRGVLKREVLLEF